MTHSAQIAYCAFTKGLCRRWTYVQRTVSGVSQLFQPLEDAIRDTLIPAIVGREISENERRLLALPTRFGGLGISNPVETSDLEYTSSKYVTEDLTNLIYHQKSSLQELDQARVKERKAKMRKHKDVKYLKEQEEILETVDPLTSRSIKTAAKKSASSWLTPLPLKNMGFILNKQQKP